MMEIADFFSLYQNAVWCKNAAAMINLYHGQAVIFDMWDEGYIVNPHDWAKIINDWFDSLGDEKVKVVFEMVNVHQSGNVGFATALIQFQAISIEGTVIRSMKNRITLGLTKYHDGWKVVHQHTSAPIRSDNLTAILDI